MCGAPMCAEPTQEGKKTMKPVKLLSSALALSLLGCQAATPSQGLITHPPVALSPPAWLHGTWSFGGRSPDGGAMTVTYRIDASNIVQTSSTYAPIGYSSSSDSSLGGAFGREGYTVSASAPSETAYRLDLTKSGQAIGHVQFEKRGDTVVVTRADGPKPSLSELHGGSTELFPAGLTAGREPEGLRVVTPHLIAVAPKGWANAPLLEQPSQWEHTAHLNRQVADRPVGSITIDRTDGETDLETVKLAWMKDAGQSVIEVQDLKVLSQPGCLVRRVVSENGSTNLIRKYFVPSGGRIYSFGLVYAQDEPFERQLVTEFDTMVTTVKWYAAAAAFSRP